MEVGRRESVGGKIREEALCSYIPLGSQINLFVGISHLLLEDIQDVLCSWLRYCHAKHGYTPNPRGYAAGGDTEEGLREVLGRGDVLHILQ